MNGGWWRRNRWGLIAIVPALIAAAAVDLGDAYHRFWRSQPRRPVTPAADGWVSFAGGRVRLGELAPATDLRARDGGAFEPPAGVRVWRAEIVVDASARDAFDGCRLLLEDDAGRTFDAGPAELRAARIPTASCTAPRTPLPASGQTTFQTMATFALPASARPVAVRLILIKQLPAYARLLGG
jgi:hypothetical protein